MTTQRRSRTYMLRTNLLRTLQITVSFVFVAATLSPTSSLAQRAKILDRLPFEVVANIVWQGQELELRKVVSCDQRRRMHPGSEGDSGLRLREAWDQSVYRVHYVLPSREVLIFELPGICRTFDKRIYPPVQDFRPVTLWVDSAEAPKVGEQIVSYRYFRDNPKRRFEFRKFRMALAKSGIEEIDDDQRLVWLLRSSGNPDAYFVGVSVSAIPKSVWGQFAALAAELRGRRTGLVARRVVEQHGKLLLVGCDGAANGIGPSERCITSQFDDRAFVISASQLSADSWRLDLDDVGVRRYVHLVDAAGLDSSGCNPSFRTCNLFKGSYQLIVDETSYEIAKSAGDLVFDAEKQLLIHPSFRVVTSTRVNPNRADQ